MYGQNANDSKERSAAVFEMATMKHVITPGVRLPRTTLGELRNGTVSRLSTDDLFAGKRVILVGVPAAFTPICSRIHVPEFVEMAPRMLSSGFDMVACIAANDPWVLSEWAKAVDPAGHIRFLSDGNLEFGESCCVTATGADLFIGKRLRRFSLVATDCMVQRFAVEDSDLSVTCSSAAQIELWLSRSQPLPVPAGAR